MNKRMTCFLIFAIAICSAGLLYVFPAGVLYAALLLVLAVIVLKKYQNKSRKKKC